MCSALIASAFFWSNRAGLELTSCDVERRHHLVEAEDVAVVGDRPAQQRQVVEQSLGDEPAVAVQEQVRLRVALGQLLVALAEHQRQVPEVAARASATPIAISALVERDLARRRGQQVLAAQHVGDPHQRVVDRVDQRVQRIAARADDHEVGHRPGLERHVAADQVGEGDVLVGHPQPQHRLAALRAEGGALLVGEVAVEVVVAQLRVAAGGEVTRLDLLGRGERLVGVAGVEQSWATDVAVDVAALGLPVGLVRAADLRALVPVQAQPAQRVEQRVVALLAVPRGVGVLDPEDERAAGVPGVGPVEQGGADQADVRRAGRRGAEPDPDRLPEASACSESVSGAACGAVSMMTPAYRRARGRTPLLPGRPASAGRSVAADEGVGQGADALDLDLDPLAADDRADAGGRAGQDDVTGQQRQGLRDVATIRAATSCTMSAVGPSCTTSPSTSGDQRQVGRSSSVSIQGPSGQNVSKPLARAHCPSALCRSRAVTSLAMV